MASVQLSPISLRLPESTAGNRNHRSSAAFNARKRPISISFAATSPESAPEAPEKPEIELEFVGPKPGADGKYPVERARAVSGEKLLRNIMSDNKIELYAAYILEGQDLLNERTNTELRYLKKACFL
ncbi:2Fe-2S ferredoxin-like superfamily protein [Actinidia rufa]|uniref:2Fe-2S ferredoxin-like superfamily protein n=1 Tax=Actinidia rufa TaxID=165716 RepID=A0A7J0GC97_9ERIC|nr:2Fe-2S ferredoxin-like superfamily protein [Actinidia rufa]